MTRQELIQAITEGKMRRASTHWHGGPALGASMVAGSLGTTIKGRHPKLSAGAGTIGQVAGTAYSSETMGKDVKRLDTTKGDKKAKAVAGARFAKKHPVTAGFVLPKNVTQQKKLARRSTLGHLGHGAARLSSGGPWNVSRYATKVSYARSGFHRKNAPMIRRKEIKEAIIKKAFG